MRGFVGTRNALAQGNVAWAMHVSNGRERFSGTRRLETPWPIDIIFCIDDVRETWHQDKIHGDRPKDFVSLIE
jgi:hypothetical protein